MKLKLKRPLIFFDLETTGLNITKDHIVQISVIKLMPNGETVSKTRLINPGIRIPEEATAVHKITDEQVRDMPRFEQIAKSLADFFAGSDIAGFNSNRFDIPMLDQEFRNVGIDFDFSKARMIDVQTIFHKMGPRNLVAAYKYYCGKDLAERAHSADGDTEATMEVLLAQVERYENLPTDVDGLADFSTQNKNVDFMGRLIFDDKNREIINFGKYKGQPAEEVLARDHGYYGWIMQGDFTENTKAAFTRILNRVKLSNIGNIKK